MYKIFSSIDDLYREMEADKHWTGADSGFRNRYPVRFVLFESLAISAISSKCARTTTCMCKA